MSEIRKHYFLDEYCIIATERGKRPSDFVSKKIEKPSVSNCVFCAGNEDKTPPSTAVYKKGDILKDTEEELVKDWEVRCIPNLYPAVSTRSVKPVLSGWEVQEGFGFHEVIVESPTHGRTLSSFSDDEIELLMKVYRDRVHYYHFKENIQYVSLFKNWGERAGASLEHIHSQLIALPILPPVLKREQDAIHAADGCPYCNMIEKERKSERMIRENNDFVAIAPYFSKSPFEVWILPKHHVNHLINCTAEMLRSFGEMIRFVLFRYEEILDFPSYNYMFYGIFDDDSYHLNVRCHPILSTPAGFEKNTDIYINTATPEDTAMYLKCE
ncbi:MAG: DUF4921 family protein [Methanosarcinaceae archaeon]|nr:DUF4921 family protein [Methanosarcinaceae archaeon]